jgi:hypothetical protein
LTVSSSSPRSAQLDSGIGFERRANTLSDFPNASIDFFFELFSFFFDGLLLDWRKEDVRVGIESMIGLAPFAIIRGGLSDLSL